jgi:hypothetical protein
MVAGKSGDRSTEKFTLNSHSREAQEQFIFAAATLFGDIADQLWKFAKSIKKPIADQTETEQKDSIAAAYRLAGRIGAAALRVTSTIEFPAVTVRLGAKYAGDTEKGIAVAARVAHSEDNLAFVIKNLGAEMLMVAADEDDFKGVRRQIKPEVIGSLRMPVPPEPKAEPVTVADARTGEVVGVAP